MRSMGVKRLADEKERQKKKPGRKKKTTHSSGMYRKRITLGHDAETGKPIVKAVYGNTKDELENKIAQLRIDRGMGVAVTDDKSTWEYWVNAWKKLKYPNLGKSKCGVYDAAIKHLSGWNPKKISKLYPLDLIAVTEKMFADGYSKYTIQSVISVARQVSHLARKNRASGIDIAEDVKPERDAPVVERQPITPEEEELLWNVKPLPVDNKMDKARAERIPLIRMVALMELSCDLRKEECVVLEWDKNVDLKSGTLKISNAYSYADKEEKGPKSKAGYRELPIPDRYLAELKEWKKQNSNTFLGCKYVFPGQNGIITQQEFKHLWAALMDTINGITISKRVSVGRKKKGPKETITLTHYFTTHQLRHTFATNAVADGVDVKSLQYLLGHSTPQMALKYVGLRPTVAEDVRGKLNQHNAPTSEDKQKA